MNRLTGITTMKESKQFLSTKEVAQFLDVNEKMVYTLISEKGLPASKVTGKWLFPLHLVEQWLENQTLNYPKPAHGLPPYHGLIIISGSNDILLDRTISLFNRSNDEHMVVFGNLGSFGGILALRRNLCHISTTHLLQEDDEDYNFQFADQELDQRPGVVNFCKREQGIILAKGNPKEIHDISGLARQDVKIVNRPLGTGTRLLFDREIRKVGIEGGQINGYDREFYWHLDVGVEILSGRADAGPGIRSVAGLLGLDFMPLRWERFDLLIHKGQFFEKGIQTFLGLLQDDAFRAVAEGLDGYDLSLCGKILFPKGN
jgi:putative molybdopterin biosynthesis protein